VDKRIGTGFRKCSFSRPRRFVTTKPAFSRAKVLHHAEARHRQAALELAERLPIVLKKLVQQAPSSRIRERLEMSFMLAENYIDHMVTCQE